MLAIEQLESPKTIALSVTSPTIVSGGEIPLSHSDYDRKVSPELRWSGVPANARSLAMLVEDPDAKGNLPYVHWVLYNLPTAVDHLPDALSRTPRPPELQGAVQGKNSSGTTGYFGPRPPRGDPPHHYHFEVFALDTMLPLDPGADRRALLDAMRGHVVASGELVATFGTEGRKS